MSKDEEIMHLAAQFEAQGIAPERALEYANNQIRGKDYQDFVRCVRDVFTGVK